MNLQSDWSDGIIAEVPRNLFYTNLIVYTARQTNPICHLYQTIHSSFARGCLCQTNFGDVSMWQDDIICPNQVIASTIHRPFFAMYLFPRYNMGSWYVSVYSCISHLHVFCCCCEEMYPSLYTCPSKSSLLEIYQ